MEDRGSRIEDQGSRVEDRGSKIDCLLSSTLYLRRSAVFTLFVYSWLIFGYATSLAQRHPVLRPAARDYFAGKIVLITRDERPQSLQQSRMIARVADHDLITPPARVLAPGADAGALIDWARSLDYADAAGVIVSLDAIGGGSPQPERPDVFNLIRARRQSIPIYVCASGSSDQSSQAALDLAANSTVDFLLITGEVAARSNLADQIAARKLSGKVAIEPEAEAGTTLLLSRMLNRRFGFAPKIFPIFSSVEAESSPPRQGVSLSIRNSGAGEPDSPADARGADVLLFVHAPRTTGPNRIAFLDAIGRAVENGLKVAVADISETKESKEALMGWLRNLKLLDKLIAYASSTPGDPGSRNVTSADAIIRAVSQASAFLNAVKFMRDDIDRVLRFNRAQVELLFSRYLTDWAYALTIRPALDDFVKNELKADPDRLPDSPETATERAEAFAFGRIKQIAEELFKEQFRRNIHTVLLSGGERAQLQISLMQRLQVRLATRKTSEAEIRQSVYMPQINFSEFSSIPGRANWSLETDDVDERIERRFISIDWGRFKSDVGEVTITIKLSSRQGQQGSQESYAISSSRKGEARRVTIAAPSNQGVFYALSKLEALGANGRLAEDFQISESPAIARRGVAESFSGSPWSHGDRLETLRFLGLARMNRYVYAPNDDDWRKDYTEQELERFRQLIRAAEENFVGFVYGLRPGISFGYSSDEAAAIARKVEALAALGANGFALRFDGAPVTLQNGEAEARLKTLALAQANLIKFVYARMKEPNADFEIYVAPAFFADARINADYMKELRAAIPQDVLLLLSSASGAAEFRRPVVWDNFAAGADEPWRFPMGAKLSERGTSIEGASGFIAAAGPEPRASRISIATAADYAWDWRNYNAQQAFDRALNLLYDERARAALRVWTKEDNSVFKPLFQQQIGLIDIEAMKRRLAELQSATEMIGATLDQGLLRGELARFIEKMKR